MSVHLTQYDALPPGLLQWPARDLHRQLSGPTLIHLPGRERRPLFLSVLLHGNEDAGWEALRRVLACYGERTLPRSLSVLIGNVAAARHGLRHLDGQPDYNRVWEAGDTPEHAVMAQVSAHMAERRPFASVDVHNNTGLNPHYGCINRLEHTFLHLATLFSRTVVYFVRPTGVQSTAFSRICPSVTVECGKAGQMHGVEHAAQFIEALLRLSAIPTHPVASHDYDLFHTVAQVKVPAGLGFGFEAGADLQFDTDLDRLNFRELPPGTRLGRVRAIGARLEAWNERGEDVADAYFAREAGDLVTRVPVMPSMLTLDAEVIRQDCLCYLMERLPPLA